MKLEEIEEENFLAQIEEEEEEENVEWERRNEGRRKAENEER